MKCPNCSYDMTSSNGGWLCVNCGYTQGAGLVEPSPSLALSPPPPTAATSSPEPAPAPAASGPVAGVVPRPSHKRRWILIGLGLLLLLLVVAPVAYAYAMAPRTALGMYLQRLSGARTSTFAATVSFTDESNARLSGQASGSYDLTKAKQPKLDLKLSGTNEGGSLAGQLRLVDEVVYFRLDNPGFIEQLLGGKVSKDWYKYDLREANTVEECVTSSKMLAELPVKNVAFKGVETIQGSPRLHYQGALDVAKLPAALERAKKQLPAKCQIDAKPDDYKGLSLSYDLWQGWSADRMKLRVSDATTKTATEATVDTGSYNQPVNITAPSGAKDVAELLGEMFSTTPQ
jgi:hypothetical protein